MVVDLYDFATCKDVQTAEDNEAWETGRPPAVRTWSTDR